MKPKQTNIIFIRHGETDMNRLELYFGHLNPELNSTGRNQLKKTKKMLKYFEKNIDIVFSSDLKRCVESMEILKINDKIKKTLLKDFREINFGIFEGKTYEQIVEEFPEEVEKMNRDWKIYKFKGGESLKEVMERAVAKLEELVKKYKNRTLIIVTHAGIIKTVVSYYLYGNIDGYWKIKIDNGSMTKMCILEDKFIYFDYINRI
ncbi:MAG: histidine phosphatase family protein [Leptotrichiaceae bacterium]|nr:histidine phosphatase family protein [Leptotrichiaceae bacterium]